MDNRDDMLQDATIVINLLEKIPEKYKKRLISVMKTNDVKKILSKCKKLEAEAKREFKNE